MREIPGLFRCQCQTLARCESEHAPDRRSIDAAARIGHSLETHSTLAKKTSGSRNARTDAAGFDSCESGLGDTGTTRQFTLREPGSSPAVAYVLHDIQNIP